jgi:transcriptional repressor NrdR
MQGLKKLDHIAYIRFASVYREFADIGALKREVDTLALDHEPMPARQQALSSEASIQRPGDAGRRQYG